jgi:hypothetical protein
VNRKAFILMAALMLSCLCALSVSAQTREEAARAKTSVRKPAGINAATAGLPQQDASPITAEAADLAITATVTAKELLFEVVPDPKVEFPGKPQRDTVWEAERENLPRPVEPGVTYRDIGIRLKIVSRFADIERIVAEALGEVPVTDETPPEKQTPQSSTQPPPVSTLKRGPLK